MEVNNSTLLLVLALCSTGTYAHAGISKSDLDSGTSGSSSSTSGSSGGGTSSAGGAKVKTTGDVFWTPVSGDTSENAFYIGTNNDAYAAISIQWWEAADKPCKFMVYKRNLNADDIHTPWRDICFGLKLTQKWVKREGENEYITAAQVCRNEKKDSENEKFKGLRLWGRIINKNSAALGPENGPSEDKHTHCKVWQEKVSCPQGQIATKIKLYTTDSEYGYAKGIALGCRPIAKGSPTSGD